MSTAASRHRGSQRVDSPATPLTIVISGALLIAVGAGIAVHNLASNEPTTAGEVANRAEGDVFPARPSASSTRASRDGPPSRVPAGVIPPTASPVPVPSPAAITYEAEAPDVIRSDGVALFPFAGASGGQVAGNIRDGRTVRFVNVAAEGQGDFALVVFYLGRSPHTAQVRINDAAAVPLSFPAVGDNQIGAVTLRVLLLVGLNTIEFGGDCPALDRISV